MIQLAHGHAGSFSNFSNSGFVVTFFKKFLTGAIDNFLMLLLGEIRIFGSGPGTLNSNTGIGVFGGGWLFDLIQRFFHK